MMAVEREFQVFTKPVGPKCNLGCSYCYYLAANTSNHLMSDETLELYIRQLIDATTEQFITFSWHGGEPLLAGIEFYEKALEFQSIYKPEGKIILNGIQTNCTLITEKWCEFFSANNFAVGVSIDGPEVFHNRNRVTKNGDPTWHSVVRGILLLERYGIVPELLCVVNSENVYHPAEVYKFLKSLGVSNITFLPLVERLPGSDNVTSRSVPSDDFGTFLCKIFDDWSENDIGEVKVQLFEEALRTAFNQPHTLCVFKENCGGVPVIEHDGDFYSCDHYVNREHLLGNIHDASIAKMLDSERQSEFGFRKSKLPSYCKTCDVVSLCNGECPRNRFILAPDGEYGLNYLCEGYRKFFRHCRPFIDAVSEVYKAG
jgi:uncharacterized protein